MEYGRSNLTSEKMRTLFNDLNELLVKANKHIRLVLCGGAVMVAYGARNMTDDIDTANEFTATLQVQINILAEKYNIAQDWLNCDSYGAVPAGLPQESFLTYSNLTVDKLTDEGMLVSKINASRGAGKTDLDDAKFFIKRLGYSRNYVEKLCERYGVSLSATSTHDNRNKAMISRRIAFMDDLYR